jgi:hypothetical protein
LDKQISSQSLELKATQDDLAKAKAAVQSARSEIEILTVQRDEARAAVEVATEPSPEHVAELERLTKDLSRAHDDLAANTDMLALTKASLQEMSANHSKELEDGAKARAEEVTKLRATHDEELTTLAIQKSDLLVKLSDLEGELATVKASIAVEQSSSPKTNGNGYGAAHPPSPGVTKEELQKMHEAHNSKLYDVQADHERAMKVLREELESAQTKAEGLEQDVARKAMEIQYLEQEQDENQDKITRYIDPSVFARHHPI